MTGRRGVVLADVLIAMVVLGLAGTLCARSVLWYARILRGAQARAGLESAFAVAGGYLTAEVGALAPGDLLYAAPDSLGYRAIWGSALACRVAGGEVLVLAGSWSGDRLPQAGRDSLLVFSGRSPAGAWVPGPVTGVGRSACDGRAALRLTTQLDTTRLAPAPRPAQLPVLLSEHRQLRFYSSLGDWWLGARSVSSSEGIQPLAGPFAGPRPPFSYRDSTGAPAPDPARVRQIVMSLAGEAAAWSSPGARFRDSLTFIVTPANLSP